MKKCIGVLFSAVIMTLSSLVATAADDLDWQQVKDDKGVKVFLAEVAGSNIKAFKGEIVVDAGLYQVLAVLDDAPGFVDWMHDCRESVLIESASLLERVQYLAIDFPWPTADRDMLLLNQVNYDQSTMSVTIRMSSIAESALSAELDIADEEKRRRAKNVAGQFLLQGLGDEQTRVTYQLHMDPAGSIPAGIVNAKLVDNPYYSLLALQKQAKLTKYQDFDPLPILEAESITAKAAVGAQAQ